MRKASLSCVRHPHLPAAALGCGRLHTCSTISFSCCCCNDCCRSRWFCCTSAAAQEQSNGEAVAAFRLVAPTQAHGALAKLDLPEFF